MMNDVFITEDGEEIYADSNFKTDKDKATIEVSSHGIPQIHKKEESESPKTEALSTVNTSWFQNPAKAFVNKVLETTKSSISAVVTTIDPGMTSAMYGSESMLNVVVATGNQSKLMGINNAFNDVFGMNYSITDLDVQSVEVANQPVGYKSAFKACCERIKQAIKIMPTSGESNVSSQSSNSAIVFVAVENFIIETLPDRWFDIGCLVASTADVENSDGHTVLSMSYTSATPIPEQVIDFIKGGRQDVTGFSRTVGEAFVTSGLVADRKTWHKEIAGVSRATLIHQAAGILALKCRSLLNKNT